MTNMEHTDPIIKTLLTLMGEVLRQNEALKQEIEVASTKNNEYATALTDIRTPLAVIRTSASIIERYHDRISAERRNEHLGYIDNQIEHIIELISRLNETNPNNFHANRA
jgi:K+-sensing histidine kinase KdpD